MEADAVEVEHDDKEDSIEDVGEEDSIRPAGNARDDNDWEMSDIELYDGDS